MNLDTPSKRPTLVHSRQSSYESTSSDSKFLKTENISILDTPFLFPIYVLFLFYFRNFFKILNLLKISFLLIVQLLL